jgi:hypothetical protein
MRRRVALARAAASGLARHLSASAAPAPDAGLVVCVACRRDFVNPVEWEPVGDARWWILLRCGQCGVMREVTVSDGDAQCFDAALNQRAVPIERAVERLSGAA